MSSNGCYDQASVLEGLVADGKTHLMNTTHVNRDANGNVVSYYAGSFDLNTREMLIFAGNSEIERSDSEIVGTIIHESIHAFLGTTEHGSDFWELFDNCAHY
jgi:hypothetical protein